MTRYQALLLDFDGVILDSERVHWEAWAETLKTSGITLSWYRYKADFIGVDDCRMIAILAAEARPPQDGAALWRLYPAKQELFLRRIAADPRFAPGIQDFLRALATSMPLGLVTSSGRAEVEPILVQGGIREVFGAIVFGSDVRRHKPDPEPYLLAAGRLGVRRALVVEDSAAGVASGRRAGFDVLEISDIRQVVSAIRGRLGIK